MSWSGFPEDLSPTPAQLECLVSTASRFCTALDRYGALLAGRPAEAIRDKVARKVLFELVTAMDDLVSVPNDHEPLLDGEPEVWNWPGTLQLRDDLCELWRAFVAIVERLVPALPNLTSLYLENAPPVICCRWSLKTGERDELVALWYRPDTAERMAELWERTRKSNWSLGWDCAELRVRERLYPPSDGEKRFTPKSSRSPGEVLQELVDATHQLGRVQPEIIFHTRERRKRAERNEQPLDLPEDYGYEWFDIVLDDNFRWPVVQEWWKEVISEYGLDAPNCDHPFLLGDFEVAIDYLKNHLHDLTWGSVKDQFGRRELVIPIVDLPYATHCCPWTKGRDWEFVYPEDVYARNPWKRTTEIEALTRTRLKDGENPLWFIHTYEQFLKSSRDPAVSFHEYCHRLLLRRVDLIVENAQQNEAAAEEEQAPPCPVDAVGVNTPDSDVPAEADAVAVVSTSSTIDPPLEDGPLIGNRFRFENLTHDLSPVLWKLLNAMWSHEIRNSIDVEEEVWGTVLSGDQLKSAMRNLNDKLKSINYPRRLSKVYREDQLVWK
jgi:hypothetical protein